ncbi:MAG: NUDIX domain-containing protein [Actinomycetota bacterium]|nr:NUDIX domain-containing protein [Actinomycetota bacterium]
MSTELGSSPAEFSAGGVVVDGDQIVVIVPVKRGPGGRRVLGLPKGHLDGDETPAQAAAREVSEEAGVSGELLGELGDVDYDHAPRGRPIAKRVRFFLFAYRAGDPADHDHEIERAYWMPLSEAVDALTYDGEREMVRRAMSWTVADR